MNRRYALTLLLTGVAVLSGCAGTSSEKLVGKFHIDPADPYAELKKYRSSVAMLTARLTVAYQNLFTIGELYKEGPRGQEILDASLKDIKLLHGELGKYLQRAPEVKQTIPSDQTRLLEAYAAYVRALSGVAAVDYGELNQEKLDALVKAASDMEPLIP